MGQVSIRLNGYVYSVGCQDGEEHHLYSMARQVESWLQRARTLGGAASESKTLMMAALLMADEIFELKRRPIPDDMLATVEEAKAALRIAESRQARLAHLTQQVEGLAEALEKEG
ncbi:cell division protein ZapA [Gluconobacter cerinus]|uniref:cell division protein ZapA n=1 Tax=Gluconobacter cerinus TaxID=38307 RepID=UPI001B8A9BB5|nr:cell division protein ZapA [Gluconobacter cerinus]MBS1020412.1 cell division protein ZapA [Gluconobacter cerinus]